MLLLIGDIFGTDLGTYINGAVVSLRVKGDRLAVWLKKIDDLNIIKTIGFKLKDLLNISSNIQIIYEVWKTKKIFHFFFYDYFLSIMNQNSMNVIMKFVLSYKSRERFFFLLLGYFCLFIIS
jgi:hypothetical protein